MSENIRKIILDMSLAGIMAVVEILREHPEVVSVEIKTKGQAIAEVSHEQ